MAEEIITSTNADTVTDHEYNASEIQVLKGLEAVRKRPGMYIGSTGERGLHHLVYEIVDNAIDEALAGYCDHIEVKILKDNIIQVTDNGRGIPVDIQADTGLPAVTVVYTILHAGGKFGGENSGYKVAGGLHGVGASVTNALSEWLQVEVKHGTVYKMSFRSFYNARKKKYESGVPDGPLENTGVRTKLTGTTVRFKPDAAVFSETNFDLDTVEERLNELAFLNCGLEITLTDERITMADAKRMRGNIETDEEAQDENAENAGEASQEESEAYDRSAYTPRDLFDEADAALLEKEPYSVVFKYDGGISDFVRSLNEEKKKLYPTPVYYKTVKNDISIEFAVQHTTEYTESIFSFVNNIPTPEGGYHEAGFRSGIAKAFNDYARSNGFLKEKDANFQGDDFREGLTAVLSVKMREVQFEGQTKTKLGNTEARPAVEAAVIEGFKEFANTRGAKKTFEEIIKKAQGAAKVRLAAKQAKDNARAKNSIDGLTLIGKLASCSGRKPELNEMFIVEGDSAGGTAKQARIRQFQSILPLRGKPLNVEKKRLSQILENEEIKTIIGAIGAGIDGINPGFNLDKINYHKVIILSDADQDGMHIRCILLTFFFRYMRDLVNAGHVYIGMPPLYKVYKGDKVEYAYDDKELAEKIAKVGKGYQLQRYKGLGEMSADQLWDTTMNPATRNLTQVTIEDAAKAERMITTLMGDKVEGRKEFLAKYANFNKHDEFMDKIDGKEGAING